MLWATAEGQAAVLALLDDPEAGHVTVQVEGRTVQLFTRAALLKARSAQGRGDWTPE
ncbi:hypothetical protein GO986_17385 [Deinococcus sp. HMF7620]|uniref:Uncharacterized protein n=1 Tax=Deinococcus arboris TaxID=2682977 RepID=A0A7C9LQG0_9DEIO|nr:hypothetical protein [Deinococcus arboris]MVN88516.1 hypothetical protein [Deinococcus arboris]